MTCEDADDTTVKRQKRTLAARAVRMVVMVLRLSEGCALPMSRTGQPLPTPPPQICLVAAGRRDEPIPNPRESTGAAWDRDGRRSREKLRRKDGSSDRMGAGERAGGAECAGWRDRAGPCPLNAERSES